MLTFAAKRMEERASRNGSDLTTSRDFLARCMEAQAKHPDVVTDRMILLYIFNNIGAGSDTTATTLTSVRQTRLYGANRPGVRLSTSLLLTSSPCQIFYYLLKTPASLQKLVDEIDRADAEGHLSHVVTWEEAGRLRYFQACVKEALRESPSSSDTRSWILTTAFSLQECILLSG